MTFWFYNRTVYGTLRITVIIVDVENQKKSYTSEGQQTPIYAQILQLYRTHAHAADGLLDSCCTCVHLIKYEGIYKLWVPLTERDEVTYTSKQWPFISTPFLMTFNQCVPTYARSDQKVNRGWWGYATIYDRGHASACSVHCLLSSLARPSMRWGIISHSLRIWSCWSREIAKAWMTVRPVTGQQR